MVTLDIDMGDEANDMGDDRIDTVISHIDMGYLVTLGMAMPSTVLALPSKLTALQQYPSPSVLPLRSARTVSFAVGGETASKTRGRQGLTLVHFPTRAVLVTRDRLHHAYPTRQCVTSGRTVDDSEPPVGVCLQLAKK
jgi:hypothetical protein